MKARKNLIVIIASTGVFFEALDIAIVNLAMPSIQQDFQLATDEIQWMQTLYILSYGGFLIIGGRLADTIGRRRTFVIGNIIFLVTSLGAAISFRYDMLIFFRGVQGVGAAFMMPSALSIITNTFDNGPERTRAVGIFGAFAAVGSGSGMSVGGMIATWFGWQSVFLINIPVIAITLLLTFLYIDRGTATHTALRKVFRSLVPGSLLRIPDLLLAGGVMMLLGAFFTGFLFLVSMLLQNNMHYSAAQAGLMLFPFSLLSALTSKIAPPYLMRKMRVHQAAVIGMMLMAIGSVLIVASMSWGYSLVLLLSSFACISGAGMAICFTTLTVLSVQSVATAQHGVASGVVTTVYFLGGGLGLAALSTVMDAAKGNEITTLPVIMLTMFAVAGVAGLLYFGGRNLSDSNNPAGSVDNNEISQEAA
jgi:predicted MFS family arabinose efflux permease